MIGSCAIAVSLIIDAPQGAKNPNMDKERFATQSDVSHAARLEVLNWWAHAMQKSVASLCPRLSFCLFLDARVTLVMLLFIASP
jgi:hypothetical protein